MGDIGVVNDVVNQTAGLRDSPTAVVHSDVVNSDAPHSDAKKTAKGRQTNLQPNLKIKTHIGRVLKQVHPDQGMTRKGLYAVHGILEALAVDIMRHTQELCNMKTITSRHVQAGTRFALAKTSELCKHAISEACKALTKYTASREGKTGRSSRSMLANLVFPIPAVEKFMRARCPQSRIGGGASIYLTAVLEYIAAELLELGGNFARDLKFKRIRPRDVQLAIFNDEELTKLMNNLHVVIAEGGVLPGIHHTLQKGAPKRSKRRQKEVNDSPDDQGDAPPAKRARRMHPGTVALRHIRREQRSTELVLQHRPFRRVLVAIANDSSRIRRFSPKAVLELQHYVEARIVELLEAALKLTIHAGRKRVLPADIRLAARLVLKLCGSDMVYRSAKLNLGGLRRLSQRAGIKFVGQAALLECQRYALGLLEMCFMDIEEVARVTMHEKVTLTSAILHHALQMRGVSLAQ